MADASPVIWVLSAPAGRLSAAPLLAAMAGRARVSLRPPEEDPSAALEATPPGERPDAGLCLLPSPPPGVEGLPCPVLGWGGGRGPEGELPADPGEAGEALLAAARRGLEMAWRARVQVNLPLKDLLGRYLSLARGAGLNLEVGLDADSLALADPATLGRVRELLAGRRTTCHLPFFDLTPASVDPWVAEAAVRRLGQAGEAAVALEARTCVLHLGYLAPLHRDAPGFARRLAERLAPLAGRLTAAGTVLCLENTFEPDPGVLLLCRERLAAAGEVGFCLDVGHAACFSRTDLPTWWRELAPHLRELHLHDNDGSDDQHWPVGRGRVDWAFLGRELGRLPAPPILTLEPHREPHLWASVRGLGRLWGGAAPAPAP